MANRKTKTYYPWGVFIMFIILAIFIFFLPTLNDYFDNRKTRKFEQDTQKSVKQKKGTTEFGNSVIYDFSDNLEITDEDIIINKFNIINNQVLTMNFYNKSPRDTINLNEENYFVELYNESNKMLSRIKVDYYKTIIPNSYITWSTELTEDLVNNLKKITIVRKTINDYPEIDVKSIDGVPTLSCTKLNETVNYEFNENKELTTIVYKITNTDKYNTEYEALKSKYKDEAINKDLINGINTSFQEDNNGFIYIIRYELKSMSTPLDNIDALYEKDTSAKIINFELTSKGYICK